MRRFVALFLLVLLPLQAIWAAAAPYCQHEGEAASHHIGHHQPEHRHATGADAPDAHGAPVDAGDHGDHGDEASSTHSDCHVCHSGTVLVHEVRLVQAMPASTPPAPTLTQGLPAPPTERPERPKWPALA